ncbi:hypothetical protein [Demequina sp.]|uniref:hypothetical protein n=1 Tax=Demequina sp. TaxID=2050685 RepID=UPI003A89F4CA
MSGFAAQARAIPLYATGATVVGAFIIGMTTLSRVGPQSSEVLDSLPETALVGGLEATAGALIINPLFLVAVLLRYLGYKKLAAKRGENSWVRIIAWCAETVFAVVALNLVLIATEPVLDAGFAWMLYAMVVLLWFVVSAVFFVVTLVIKKPLSQTQLDARAAKPTWE